MKRKAEDVEEKQKDDSIAYFKAKDESIAVFDVTDLSENSQILGSLLRSDTHEERKASPLIVDTKTSLEVYRGLSLLLAFREPRDMVAHDVDSLEAAVSLIYNLMVSTPFFVNVCTAIEKLCGSVSQSWEDSRRSLALSLLSSWVRLVDPTRRENKDLNRAMKHDLSSIQNLIPCLQSKEMSNKEIEVVGDAALFSRFSPTAGSYLTSHPPEPDSSLIRKTLLKLISPKNLDRIRFHGEWVRRFVSGRRDIHDDVAATVTISGTFRDTVAEILSWVHDDAFVEFGSESGLSIRTRESVRIRIFFLNAESLGAPNNTCAASQCSIRFEPDGQPTVTESLSCNASNRRKAVVSSLTIVDALTLSKEGYAIFDRSFRKLDVRKLESMSPVYALATPPERKSMTDYEFANVMSSDIRLDGCGRFDCLTARSAREALEGFTDGETDVDKGFLKLTNHLVKVAKASLQKDVEACFD
jgi:hypothetical protein